MIRMGMLSLFVRVAWEQYYLMLEQEKKINELEAKKIDYDEKKYEKFILSNKLDEYIVSVIVFSALAIESYIYDYSARNLGDKFTKEYLEKLDVVSKWIIIIKLVNGKELEKGGEAYSLLKELVRTRNTIVHNKSKKIEDINKVFENKVDYLDKAKNAIKTLVKLAEEIEKIDSNEKACFLLGVETYKDSKYKL